MALALKFCYKPAPSCDSILFRDTTGAYDAVTNETGYGSPNTAIADITAAVLIITKPDDTQVIIDLYDTFPTINTELIHQITADDLGYASVIEDGLYTFTYKLTTNENTYIHTTQTLLFSCTLNCQIKKILADSVKFQMNCDDCNSEINENIFQAVKLSTMFDGLLSMSGCGTSTLKIKNALENLQTLVSEYDVEDCNCR